MLWKRRYWVSYKIKKKIVLEQKIEFKDKLLPQIVKNSILVNSSWQS
jgi:hypothetical protein